VYSSSIIKLEIIKTRAIRVLGTALIVGNVCFVIVSYIIATSSAVNKQLHKLWVRSCISHLNRDYYTWNKK